MRITRLATALALACAAAPSFAYISTTDEFTELYAVAWDENVGSYTIDTGIKLNDFIAASATPGYSFSVKVGAPYQQFVAADTNPNDATQSSGTRWGIFAADVQSFGDPGEADGYRYLTTTYKSQKSDVLNGDLQVGTGSAALFASNVSFTGTNPSADPAVNTDSYNAKGQPGQFIETDTNFPAFGVFAGNKLNTPTKFSYYYTGSIDSFAPATRIDLVGDANFDGTAFTYAVAAVPEPGTYALMLAGLLTVGFVARRRG